MLMRPLPLAALAGLALLSACAAQVIAPPYPPVPPPQAEMIPKPPVSEQPLIWQPGHWDYTGASYAWTGGAWVLRAGHGTAWQDGYWTQVNGAWSWVAPHWT
jgi:hypothetical protein